MFPAASSIPSGAVNKQAAGRGTLLLPHRYAPIAWACGFLPRTHARGFNQRAREVAAPAGFFLWLLHGDCIFALDSPPVYRVGSAS